MKAAVFHGVRDIRLEERPIPQIGPDDVLLKSRMAAICGSDIQPYLEGTGGVDGEVFGHEFVAEIVAVSGYLGIMRPPAVSAGIANMVTMLIAWGR